jgi:hypothetical protein
MHREHVDDVGPIIAVLVAVAEKVRGDRVTVSLVADQDPAERVAGRGRDPRLLNRSDLPPRANEDREDQDEDDESEDHQAQVRGLELRAGSINRWRRAGVDRCPAAVAHTTRIRYRCGRDVRIVGPVNAHIELLSVLPTVQVSAGQGNRAGGRP